MIRTSDEDIVAYAGDRREGLFVSGGVDSGNDVSHERVVAGHSSGGNVCLKTEAWDQRETSGRYSSASPGIADIRWNRIS